MRQKSSSACYEKLVGPQSELRNSEEDVLGGWSANLTLPDYGIVGEPHIHNPSKR